MRDNGKLFAEMHGQLNYIPHWYYYYGGLADKVQGAVLPLDKKGYFAFTRNEPLGVVAAITPWNSPLMLASWKIAPALAAGCTVVIKPSEFTSASVLEFARLIEQAGFPPGVVNIVTGFGADVGMPLVEHPLTNKIAFTGSERTGGLVYQQAAKGLKRVTMELGGKSPQIVFADADLDTALPVLVNAIIQNGGQTCSAGSRVLIEKPVYAELATALAERFSRLVAGPHDADLDLGPLINQKQKNQVAGMVAVADGTPSADRRLERVLTADPGTGVMRHADAGYELAIETARERGVDLPMVDR